MRSSPAGPTQANPLPLRRRHTFRYVGRCPLRREADFRLRREPRDRIGPRISAGGGARRGRGGGLDEFRDGAQAPRRRPRRAVPARRDVAAGRPHPRLPVQPISCPSPARNSPQFQPSLQTSPSSTPIEPTRKATCNLWAARRHARGRECQSPDHLHRRADRPARDHPRCSGPHDHPGISRFLRRCRPMGAYPSYVDEIYGRDDEAYVAWDKLSRSESELGTWIDTEIRQHASFADYVAGIGAGRLAELERRGREGRSGMSLGLRARRRVRGPGRARDPGRQVCFVGIGVPSLAAMAAKRFHAPKAILVYEIGCGRTRRRYRPCRRAVHR